MHGLINRSIEGFLRDTYGDVIWRAVAEASEVDPRGFQTIRDYPDKLTIQLIRQATTILDKPEAEMLEDLGAWLAQIEAIRRLLRFSGRNFGEFLLALDELPGRAHMVLPSLGMPPMRVTPGPEDSIVVTIRDCLPGWRSVVAGVIRAMADDYGALGLIEVVDRSVIVHVSLDDFSEGRDFRLAASPPEVEAGP